MATSQNNNVVKVAGSIVGIALMVFSGIFLLIGIIFLILSAVFLEVNKSHAENYIPTEAVISEIRISSDSSDAYATYVVDGKKLKAKLDVYSSDMYEGQQIEIYYDPDDPSDVTYLEGMRIFTTVFSIIGAVLTVIGLIPLIIGIVIVVKCNKKAKAQVSMVDEMKSADYSDRYTNNDDDRYGGLGEGIE